jgi:hypothetical protein
MSAISRIRWRINESKRAIEDTGEDFTPPSTNVATPYTFPHIRLGSSNDKLAFIDDVQQQKGYFPDHQNDSCFLRFAPELRKFLMRSAQRQAWYDPHTEPEISDKVSHFIANCHDYPLSTLDSHIQASVSSVSFGRSWTNRNRSYTL